MSSLLYSSKNTILSLIKQDRPDNNIYEVLDFQLNTLGFYNVEVLMDLELLDVKIEGANVTIAYPKKKYDELQENIKVVWCGVNYPSTKD